MTPYPQWDWEIGRFLLIAGVTKTTTWVRWLPLYFGPVWIGRPWNPRNWRGLSIGSFRWAVYAGLFR